ncbi:GNAT family N-acetyltransferase [Herbidospora sp. NBRC 101105]|uniref:GNAT family N-acetyltransferase n=1 Tax=Herbidospora sp. NBRC 101105 TaxID=3032195 RepID=UPI0024A39322|nr:GNAT family N-acetyltransferase [Herbidospora sp. NBRC 101105]GLX99067.1 N-acetyltransferase [Herbidospora sp. NBRC 101105]
MVRTATRHDIPELVRLRALLFDDLGGEFFSPADPADDWRAALARVFGRKLAEPDCRILVVDADTGLAACGIGTVEQWFPGPHSRNGRIGHVIGMVTDPAHRRRGHSRAIMLGLLGWFRERDAVRVDLTASRQAEPLYRDLGFADHPDPLLCWKPSSP